MSALRPIPTAAWSARRRWVVASMAVAAAAALLVGTIAAGSGPGRLESASPWNQWWSFRPVSIVTINSILAPRVLGFSPAFLLALAAILASTILVAWAIVRRRDIRPGLIFGIIAATWLINDARVLAAQGRQLQADVRRFEDRRPELELAATWPPAIAQMATLARANLPHGCVYAVAGGNLPDSAGDTMLRYLLAPRFVQINVDPLQPRVDPSRAEYILVLDRNAVREDIVTGVLAVPGLPPGPVKKLLDIAGGPFIAKRVAP